MVFCSGRAGTASYSPDAARHRPEAAVRHHPEVRQAARRATPRPPCRCWCSSVDYNDFVGRIGIGRIQNGVIKVGQDVQVCDWHNPDVSP